MIANLETLEFEKQRLFVVCGAGGVGKTTLAASLGIALAEKGYRTLVLTVDPARRLAQALGFTQFKEDVHPIPLPFAPEASLFGSMLDSSRYFDRLMEKFAKTEEQRQKILAHPLYRLTMSHLGGTQEYAAMERLLEFAEDDRFDKIIIDTPPTANAMDLFTAPRRMAEFMDGQVVRWFRADSGGPFSFLKQGTKLAMKLLQKIFGGGFFDQLAELLSYIEGMEAGFVERHQRVLNLLSDDKTSVFLVSLPNETRFGESVGFSSALKEFQISIRAIFLNQLEPRPQNWQEEIKTLPAESQAEWQKYLGLRDQIAVAHLYWQQRFKDRYAPLPVISIPRSPEPMAGLADLREFAKRLTASF